MIHKRWFILIYTDLYYYTIIIGNRQNSKENINGHQAIEGSVDIFPPQLPVWRGLDVQPAMSQFYKKKNHTHHKRFLYSELGCYLLPEVQTLRHRFHNLRLPAPISSIGGLVCERCVVEGGGSVWNSKIKMCVRKIWFHCCSTSRFGLQDHPIARRRGSWYGIFTGVAFCTC